MRATSYSALTTHRACPNKYQFRYVQRLTEAETTYRVMLEFGTWWHALRAADSIERGKALDTLKSYPEGLHLADDLLKLPVDPCLKGREPKDYQLKAEVLRQAAKWWAKISDEHREAFATELGKPLPEHLEYTDARWREKWANQLENEAPLAVEMKWTNALPKSMGRDTSAEMIGYIDELYYDRKRRIVVARDHKTHKDLDGKTSSQDEMMDSQLQVYAWGANDVVKSWGFPGIRATAYDRVKSVAPKPPTLTKSGRLSQRGGVSSISSTDLTTYRAWAAGPEGKGVPFEGMKKDGSGAGYYVAEDEIIERLQEQEGWFYRSTTPLNRNIVRAHLTAAADTAADIETTLARVEKSGEAARNLGPSCRWCSYDDLCRAQMVGGPLGEYDLAVYGLRKEPPRGSK